VTDQRRRSGLEDLFEDIEGIRRERRPGWRRWVRRGVLGLLGLLVLAALLSIPPAIGAGSKLLDARADLRTGREALLAGELDQAERAFERAGEAFAGARDDLGNLAMRVMSWLPLLGRTPDAVTAITEAGELVASAGRELARSGGGLPGQMAALAPRDGRIPLGTMRRLAPSLDRAAGLLGRAEAIMSDSPNRWLPGPVADPRHAFAIEVAEAHRIVRGAAALARTIPAFLGADGPRTYLVGAQNPAELRGTGGFIGAYAIMTAQEGRIELGPFLPKTNITPSRVEGVEPPNPDYARIYDPWGGAGLMHNINMTPDFPSAAVAIERLYDEVTGRAVDGVIVADPDGLAALMEVTGPASVPGLGLRVSADTVVPFISNEAYARLSDPTARKRVLGEVAGRVLETFLAGAAEGEPAAAGRAVADAAAEGHLLLHSTDPEVQSAFRAAGVDGRMGAEGADYLQVVVNNIGANKVDYYVDRRLRYDVRLGPSGGAEVATQVTLENGAPRRGAPKYVIGPHPGASGAGENVSIVSTYCSRSCDIQGFARDGRAEPASLEEELGHPMARSIVAIPSGGSERISYEWRISRAWYGSSGRGTYRLIVRGQPTIRPTRLAVSVRAPLGMLITRTEPDMDVDGAIATWEGAPGDRFAFEVQFARPLLSRIWSGIWDFLNQPLF
jgi:Protein of unknown function (DUF4012)